MPVVLPLIGLGAAYLALRRGSDVPAAEPSPIQSTSEGQDATAQSSTNWSALIDELRGDLPSEFISRWMSRESDGNPCATGVFGGPWEVGVGQLYFDRDQSSATLYGSTLSSLRAYCDGNSQRQSRELTGDEMRANLKSTLIAPAIQYRATVSDKLSGLGLTWSAGDILCLTKLFNALPILTTTHLSYAANSGHADDWDSYREYMAALSREEVVAIDVEMGYASGSGAAPYYPLTRLFDNAQFVGRGT